MTVYVDDMRRPAAVGRLTEADAEAAYKRVIAIARLLPSAAPEIVSRLATEWLPVAGGSTDGGGR